MLFLGPSTSSLNGAWLRVQQTFIGVGIYLIIDNCIFPNRSDALIRQSVLLSIDSTLLIYQDAIKAIKCLAEINDIEEQINEQTDEVIISESLNISKSDSMSDLQAKVDEIAPTEEYRDSLSLQNFKISMEDDFTKCEEHLKSLDNNIDKLQVLLSSQNLYLAEVVHDPEIWTRKFPIESYRELYKTFSQLLRVARAVSSGTAALRRVLMGMIEHDEDVLHHLKSFNFMSRQVFAVVTRTTAALSLTSNALHRLYEQNDIKSDLTSLITLSRYFDRLLIEVDHYYKSLFLLRDRPLVTNRDFLITWQNMFEAECDLIKNLSQLGIALHNIRDVEALSSL